MKPIYKYILLLVLVNVLLFITAYLLVPVVNLNLSITDIIILAAVFSIIAFITIFIFLKGQTKEPDSQTFYSLVAISLKFLLEILFALLWFFVGKKTSLPSVLIFFVLYLTLTLLTVSVMVKTLKSKAL